MRRWLTGSIVLTVGIALLNAPPAARYLKACALTINVLVPSGGWRPLQWALEAPRVETIHLQSEDGDGIVLRLYHPTRLAQTGIVIYTPFIGGGLDDPRLTNLAESLARVGFLVGTPQREAGDAAARERDVDDVVTAAEHLLEDVSTVGLFGISYGNGPVFAAAADLRLRETVAFLMSLNGMYDLAHVIDFIETGRFSYDQVSGSLTPHPYTQEVLDATQASLGVSADADPLQTEQGQRLREALSPASYVDQITVETFIIHSTDDEFIPYTESLRLFDGLKDRTSARLVLTDVIEHGQYRSPLRLDNLRNSYLPALSSFYSLASQLLRYASAPDAVTANQPPASQ